MSSTTAPVPVSSTCYKFGEKSAALLGLLVTSDGKVSVFAYRRPVTDPSGKMQLLYQSGPIELKSFGVVPFTLTLSPGKPKPDGTLREGLLTVEPRGWPYPYEVQRTHFLGMFQPFGDDEIPYKDLGAGNRNKNIPANRVFDGVFTYDPAATDPKEKATLTLVDVESKGQSEEWISVSAFDDPNTHIPGGILICIRVTASNYDGQYEDQHACASVEFTGGHTVTVPGTTQALSKLWLNTKNSSPVWP